ncbi:hypothetical protein Tco_0060029 [Tanacetum coccineum]
MQISQLNETRSEADRTLDFRTLDFQITQLTKKINVLQEQNELFRAENGKIKQHYKELYDSIKITRAKHLEQTTALLTENESLKVQIQNKLSCVNKDHVKPKVLAPGKYAIDVEPIPPRNRNNREVHLVYLKHLKESVETLREIVEEAKVERPLDSSLASACRYTKHSQELLEYVIGTCRTERPLVLDQLSKHMPGDRSPATEFHEKRSSGPLVFGMTFWCYHGFMEIIRDWWESMISGKHSCYVQDTDGVELIKGSRGSNLYTISVERRDEVLSQILLVFPKACQEQIKNRNSCWAARATMLISPKPPMFLWSELLALEHELHPKKPTLFHTRHNKTPYELVHDKKPDLSFFRVFGALCYLINDSEDLEKLQPTADIGIFVGYAPSRKGVWADENLALMVYITVGLNANSILEFLDEKGTENFEEASKLKLRLFMLHINIDTFLSELHGPDVADLVDNNGTSEAEIFVGNPEVLNGSAITNSEPYIERIFMTRQVEPLWK